MAFISRNEKNNSWDGLLQQHANWLEQKKSSLMIVATLIATMAFQVGVNPPSGVWQQDEPGLIDSHPHIAGFSVMARNWPVGYQNFYIVNTIAFVASLTIILLLISGLPLRRRLFMWILMVITWIAIKAIGVCYALAVAMVTPSFSGKKELIVRVVEFFIYSWIILMALLILAHTIRMILKLIKKLRKSFRRRSFAAASPRINGDNIIAI